MSVFACMHTRQVSQTPDTHHPTLPLFSPHSFSFTRRGQFLSLSHTPTWVVSQVSVCVYMGNRPTRVQWKVGLPDATWARVGAQAEDMIKTGANFCSG